MAPVIDDVKSLTTDQYDKSREKAVERVTRRIGSRPNRQAYERELGSLVTSLDLIALLVFVAAFVVSSIHIISHMGQLAELSYTAAERPHAGLTISRDLYVSVHQWMLIPLAEGSMILFLVMFGMAERNWRKWVYFTLALIAITFVLVANVQSGIGLLESLLAPAFTIGIGFKLEQIIVQSLKRRDDVNQRYLSALTTWESATHDATKHPDFLPILRQEIWQKIISLKANQGIADAPTAFRHAVVYREMQRELWAYEPTDSVTAFSLLSREEVNSISRPFGNILHEREGEGFTEVMPSDNGRIVAENV